MDDIQQRPAEFFAADAESVVKLHSRLLGIDAKDGLDLSPVEDAFCAHDQSQDLQRSVALSLHGLAQDTIEDSFVSGECY